MGRFGVPEVLGLVFIAAFWLIPVAAAVWALVTLHRIRTGQDALRSKVENIERALQSRQ